MIAIVYSGPSCGKCIATKHALKSRGIPFEERQASQHVEHIEALIERHGLTRTLPIVECGNTVWNDFRVDRISDLAAWMENA